MKRVEVPTLNMSYIENIPKIDFIDNDFIIFNGINEAPLYDYPSHIDATIVAVCLKGNIHFGINMQEYHIKANSLVVILPGQIVQLYEHSDDFAGLFLGMSREFSKDTILSVQKLLSALLYVKDHPCTELTEDDIKCISQYHTMLWEKVKMKDTFYRKEIVQSLTLSLFYEICKIFHRYQSLKNGHVSNKDKIFLQFMNSIADHYREERKLSFYADILCITSKYLSVIVKDESGYTASEIIDNYVILEAKTLLKSTNMTIQEIANYLNFANQSFFGKYFKKHTGISPKEYKKQ